MLPRDLIVFPAAAMVLLVTLVSFRFLALSIAAERNGKLKSDPTRANDKEPGKNQLAMNNVSNLFEMPVLFYVMVVLLYASDSVDALNLVLAWTYVLARYVHSFIHTTCNYIPHRLIAFLISNTLILIMWARMVAQTLDRI